MRRTTLLLVLVAALAVAVAGQRSCLKHRCSSGRQCRMVAGKPRCEAKKASSPACAQKRCGSRSECRVVNGLARCLPAAQRTSRPRPTSRRPRPTTRRPRPTPRRPRPTPRRPRPTPRRPTRPTPRRPTQPSQRRVAPKRQRGGDRVTSPSIPDMCRGFKCQRDSVCTVFGGEPRCVTRTTCEDAHCLFDQRCVVENNLAHCEAREGVGCQTVECPTGYQCFLLPSGRATCTLKPKPTPRPTPKPTVPTLPPRPTCADKVCGPFEECELQGGRPRCVTACGTLSCVSGHCIMKDGSPVCVECTLRCPKGRECRFVGPTSISASGSEQPKQQRCLRV